ncbi:MAG: NusG domain II-containing protein [Bacillota bacterium]
MNKLLKIMTAYDIIIIIGVIVLSIGILFLPFWNIGNSNSEDKVIYISQNGDIVQRIPVKDTINNQILVEVEGPIGKSVIEAYNGKVRMKEAPEEDPEKICVKTGWVERAGPSIICVPNKISIWVESEKSDLDGVSW